MRRHRRIKAADKLSEPPRSAPEAQALLAKAMLHVAAKYDDPAMRAAGKRLTRVAKQRRSD